MTIIELIRHDFIILLEAKILIQNDLYVYDVSGDGGTSSLAVGDRILEV